MLPMSRIIIFIYWHQHGGLVIIMLFFLRNTNLITIICWCLHAKLALESLMLPLKHKYHFESARGSNPLVVNLTPFCNHWFLRTRFRVNIHIFDLCKINKCTLASSKRNFKQLLSSGEELLHNEAHSTSRITLLPKRICVHWTREH